MTDTTAPFRTEISDEERRALVAVEAMDRLARRAQAALAAVDWAAKLKPDSHGRETIGTVQALLDAIGDEAFIVMATAVKDQALSDSIAADAARHVRTHRS
jgi:hypothetical protein